MGRAAAAALTDVVQAVAVSNRGAAARMAVQHTEMVHE